MKKTNTSTTNYQLPITNYFNRGQSLPEVLLVITLLGLMVTPIMISLNNLNKKYRQLYINSQANLITQQNLEIATNIIQSAPLWNNIPQPDQPTTYAPPTAPSWKFQPTNQPVNQSSYQTWLIFQPVCRDAQYQITSYTPGCQTDPYAVEVISETTWGDHQSSQISTIFTNLTNNPQASENSPQTTWICHVPPGNPSAAHTVQINLNAWINGHDEHNAHSLDFEITGPEDPACNF